MKSSYYLQCDCGKKTTIRSEEDVNSLNELKVAPVPGGVPYYEVEAKKTIIKKDFERIRVFKCPSCGRAVKTKKMLVPEGKHETIPEVKKDENINP